MFPRAHAIVAVLVAAAACGVVAQEDPDAGVMGGDAGEGETNPEPQVETESESDAPVDLDAAVESRPDARPVPDAAPVAGLPGSELARVSFTLGAHTVRIAGPSRSFTDASHGTTATVVTDSYVYLLPRPYDGTVDDGWLAPRLAGTEPDLLAIAAQYLEGAPPRFDTNGLQIAGDGGYGTAIGADFNDYLGVAWSYPSGKIDPPQPAELRNLDCSGYTRIVFGFRGGLPLSIGTPSSRASLPRTAQQQLDWGPGVLVIPYTGARVVDLAPLRPGDLVFFDASDDGRVIDHVGIYLGRDSLGHARMISSRNSMRGPVFRDGSGTDGESTSRSILDGDGLYGRSLRAARRL